MSAERIGNMKKFRKRKIWISSLLALSLLINVLSASAESVPVIESQEKSTVYSLNSVPDNIKSLLKEQTDVISIQKDDDIYSLTTNKNDGSHNTTVYSVPIKFENKNGKKNLLILLLFQMDLLKKFFKIINTKIKLIILLQNSQLILIKAFVLLRMDPYLK